MIIKESLAHYLERLPNQVLKALTLGVFLCLGMLHLDAQAYKSVEEASDALKTHIQTLQQDMQQEDKATDDSQQILFSYRYLSVFAAKLQELGSVETALESMRKSFSVGDQATSNDLLVQARKTLIELVTEGD